VSSERHPGRRRLSRDELSVAASAARFMSASFVVLVREGDLAELAKAAELGPGQKAPVVTPSQTLTVQPAPVFMSYQ